MTAAYVDSFYAREADRIARGPQVYGGPDSPGLIQLRCFKYYHPDSGSWLTNPEGFAKWVGPKTARIYAILHRKGFGGSRLTMSAISTEAMCSRSTVSRAIVRLQAFGFLVAVVTRGRNGGVVVRLRTRGDHLKHYAAAAWRRIRAWLNVASGPPVRVEGDQSSTNTYPVPKDATFTREAAIERLGAAVLAGTLPVADVVARSGRVTDADREWAAAEDFARAVIAERARIDRDEPDWDLQIDKIRASYGWE